MALHKNLARLKACLVGTVVLTLVGCDVPPSTLDERAGLHAAVSLKPLEAPAVPFCDLINNPERYRAKLVRTQITVITFPENQYVYDLSCYKKDRLAWLDFEGNKPYETLNDNLRTFHKADRPTRAYVNALGRLDGPFEEGVGHLSGFKYRFMLTDVGMVDAVPDEVPLPESETSQ